MYLHVSQLIGGENYLLLCLCDGLNRVMTTNLPFFKKSKNYTKKVSHHYKIGSTFWANWKYFLVEPQCVLG